MFQTESGRVLATHAIKAGDIVLQRPWTEHVSFVAASDDMAQQYARGSTQDIPALRSTLPEDAAPFLAHGSLICHAFSQLRTPAYLQLTCTLIEHYASIAKQWVQDKCFVRRKCIGAVDMDPMRHAVAIKWLRSQNVPIVQLTFWAVRENFTALYEMIVGNAFGCEFPLSGTTSGISFCPMLAQFNHSCLPNTYLQHLPSGYTLVAGRDIAQGEEICFAYYNHAIGLESLDSIETFLHRRFGFHCTCDLHSGKQSALKVASPSSLAAVCYRNKALKPLLQALDTAVDQKNWNAVRQLGRHLWDKYSSIVKAEPSLAYGIASRYVECIPYTTPDAYGIIWTTQFERACETYCANPVYTARTYFWTLLETVRRNVVKLVNSKTNEVEHVHTGCSEETLPLFLGRWLNIRKYLGSIFQSEEDYLLQMESHLFGGLHDYMKAMEPKLAEFQHKHQYGVNVTVCKLAQDLTKPPIVSSSFITMEQLDAMIRKNNPKVFSGKKTKRKTRKKKLFIPIQIDCDDLEDFFNKPFGTWEQGCFIPRQFDWDNSVGVC